MDVSEMSIACLWLLCTLAALIGCGQGLFAAVALHKLRARIDEAEPARPAEPQKVSILKPLYGAEPALADNLASFMDQDYPADRLQVRLGIQDPADPAGAIACRLKATRPVADIELVVDPARHGSNAKISNLINIMARCRGDVLVLADSDIAAPRHYLAAVLAALERPGAGAVTCLYHGVRGRSLWSHLTALSIDWHFLPNVLVGLATGLATPCFGSTIALRRETLVHIGGFEAFADKLADDYEIGAAVRRLGLRVEIPPLLVGHACDEASFADTWRHELRWARTVRLVDPLGYAGSAVTHPLPFALTAAIFDGGGRVSLGIVVLALACRLAVQIQAQALTGGTMATLMLGPVRDVLSFAVFIASFWPGRLTWRGTRFGVDAQGRMTPAGHDDGRGGGLASSEDKSID
jgi:ceramide glucosyltransferase